MSYQPTTAQADAISHHGGPLLLVAGPGSGKTYVLVERVRRLVKSGTPPESVLCVTFTKKAAEEIEERLAREGIMDVRVGTIHSVGREILLEYSSITGFSESTREFSELAQMIWLIRNAKGILQNEKILNARNVLDKYRAILSAISIAKRELVSFDDMERYIKKNPDSKALEDLAAVYGAYENVKLDMNLMDYDDMISAAVKVLQDNPALLGKHTYQHVLVDEFQDNNYAQFKLIHLLAGSRNITVVGDADQSIMGFQGAFQTIFQEFQKVYPDFKKINLALNHRCTRNIAELSSALLRNVLQRESKPLSFKSERGALVSVVSADTQKAELQCVAQTILERKEPYNDVAVLCRTNSQCMDFMAALKKYGIPATFTGSTNMAHNTGIVEVVSLLKISNSPYTSGMEISWLLRRYGIRSHVISAINRLAARQASGDLDCVYAALGGYTGEQDSEVGCIYDRLTRLLKDTQHLNVMELVHKIMMEYAEGYRRYGNSSEPVDQRNLQMLNTFHELAREYQHMYGGSNLADFLEYLTYIGSIDVDSGDAGKVDSVNVLTMHKSKGKEFGTVFVTGLSKNFPIKWNKKEFDIPVSLLPGSDREPDSEEAHVESERRLLYVAMTRAKNKLYLTYSKTTGSGKKESKPSRFLADLGYADSPLVDVSSWQEMPEPASEDYLETVKSRIQKEACSAIYASLPSVALHRLVELYRIIHYQNTGNTDADPSGMLQIRKEDLAGFKIPASPDSVLQNDSLSPSSIWLYMECPLKFKYSKVLRIPQKPTIYLERGNLVHGIAEELARERMAGNTPDISAAIERARERWKGESFADWSKDGTTISDMIMNYSKWEENSPNTLDDTEITVKFERNGTRYVCRIDRLERNPRGELEIIDFKTGSSIMPWDAVAADPQLNMYAEAVRKKYGTLPAKASLVYLQNNKTRSYDITSESVDRGLETVDGVAGGIVAGHFEAKTGYHCNRCPYKSICSEFVRDG